MVADRPKDSRWLSWGWWVTVLSKLGDRMWHSWKSGIDRRTNRQPDKQTDTTVYRVTPQLKLGKIGKNSQLGLSTPPPTLLINQKFFNIRMFYKITTSSPLTNYRNNWEHIDGGRTPLTLYVPGGADLSDLSRMPKYPYFALQTHAEIGWLFMYVHYDPFTKN